MQNKLPPHVLLVEEIISEIIKEMQIIDETKGVNEKNNMLEEK